jgi:predicted histone-like DNA-binding protein
MSLKYTIIRQPEQGGKVEGSFIYYARACERRKVSIDQLAAILEHRTSLTRSDIIGVIAGLSDLVPELLMDNKTVELGELGTFSLHMHSKGVSSPEEAGYRQIKDLRIQFRTGVHLKKAIGRVNFAKSEKSLY